MEYSNPQLPEGINTTETNPLKEFILLTAGVVGFAFIIVMILIAVVDNFADKIPFKYEQSLPVNKLIDDKPAVKLPAYLQDVANKVLAHAALPADMQVTVHYVNDDTVNAYATLGGHVVLYRGLLEKLRYEDELAMVIAHEIAHVKFRHPILSTSHSIIVGLALSIISNSAGDSMMSNLLGKTGMVSLMKYSRDFEYQADQDAIKSLIQIYGHADGANELFNVFKAEQGNGLRLEFMETHPLTDNRQAQINTLSHEYSVSSNKSLIPIPIEFKLWLSQQKEAKQKLKK